ncbi:MAG: hypothetical protein ACE15B_23400 [Bryobacteraceae bacterium]
MPAPKPTPRRASEADIHSAERYLEDLIAQDSLAPEEVTAMKRSIEAIRRGDMTLAEFENKYGEE